MSFKKSSRTYSTKQHHPTIIYFIASCSLLLLLLSANTKLVCAKETLYYAPNSINESPQEKGEDGIRMKIIRGTEVQPKFEYQYMVYIGE